MALISTQASNGLPRLPQAVRGDGSMTLGLLHITRNVRQAQILAQHGPPLLLLGMSFLPSLTENKGRRQRPARLLDLLEYLRKGLRRHVGDVLAVDGYQLVRRHDFIPHVLELLQGPLRRIQVAVRLRRLDLDVFPPFFAVSSDHDAKPELRAPKRVAKGQIQALHRLDVLFE